jgi:pimeloyl-ACP methyl ester carboxylesterase
VPDLRSQYAAVNGIRLHYVSSGQGKLIIFLHGFPEFWLAWENQLKEFGRDHLAVAPDMRGYNLSDKPPGVENYHVKDLIADLRDLAQYLGYEKFIMVGHDWGGGVAWSTAIRYPELLEKLIIINSPHPAIFARELLSNPDQQKASQYMLLLRSTKAERVLSEDNFARLSDILTYFGSKWELSDQHRLEYIKAWSQPDALTGSLNYYRASPLYPPTSEDEEVQISNIMNLPEDMMTVKVPTLVLWGEEDRALLTGNLDGLEDYVDDLTVRRIPDGTHWVAHEQPEIINNFIRDFIE